MAFRGTFEYTLDVKNRLTVPAKFRATLADGVVLARGVERTVAIWTPSDYERQAQGALAGRNPLSPEARELRRFFSANAIDSELDSAGRLQDAGGKSVVAAGDQDRAGGADQVTKS